MSKDQIINLVHEGITNREYIIGNETRFYIIIVKVTSHDYIVYLLDHSEILISTEFNGRLAAAKQEGVRLLYNSYPEVVQADVTMMHFKADRPSGRPWMKDSDVLAQQGGMQANMTTNRIQSTPVNKILYGPPGTGKTYNVIYEALSILKPGIDPDLLNNPQRRNEAVQLFNQYTDSNHVMFCTFHQSFSYEEFVEGIRYNEEKQHYEVQDGIFKRICNLARAATAEHKLTYNFDPASTRFFKMSLGNTLTGDDEVYDYCISNNVIALGWGEDADFSNCGDKQEISKLYQSQLPNETVFGVEAVERFKHWMRLGDIVIISYGNKKVRAIGKITGDYSYKADSPIPYHQFRSVEWLYTDSNAMLPVQSILRDKVFSQQTIYMFNHSDINMNSIQELLSGNSQDNGQEQQYVLIIDEINRGNISKIFGELITLIESDKRMGQPNELSVTLPYSGNTLHVPSNLHIIGTMNTADRSIALLDTALRRRFEFVEVLPDYSLLPIDIQGVNIRKLLETINQRIEYLYDRDHVIGHSYFMSNKKLQAEDYIRIMQKKVIPLLQEYFYEDWEQIELVLGGAGREGDNSYFLNRIDMDASLIFNRKSPAMESRKTRYIVQPNPTIAALRRVYNNSTDHSEEEQE
ncbi:AAA family ATPase [Paenibacillus sp. SN-8-1]|uniref:AAA family ATPase n=1 Tax=Paenibacillus sp. SN-8-1 TaxID=3435409 RepID=UPI003D9A9AB9